MQLTPDGAAQALRAAPAEYDEAGHAAPAAAAIRPATASPIRARTVVHFAGFEPLTAAQHHERFRRAAPLSAKAWDMVLSVGALQEQGASRFFDVACATGSGDIVSRIHIADHYAEVEALSARPIMRRILSGFGSAAMIAWHSGLHRYFRSAWRFGLFFLFPFAVLGLIGALALAATAVLLVGNGLAAGLAAAALLVLVLVAPPLVRRLHLPLLLSNWKFALMLAGPPEQASEAWIEKMAAAVRPAFDAASDEYLITAHSMGANVAVHVVGLLLQREPDLFRGKRVVFATLGGAVLQCALIGTATSLRARVGLIARQPTLSWIDVQCLTDPVSFHRSKVVAEAGHPDAPQARIVEIRVKKMIAESRYRRMRGNFLRVHRQYVLGSDFRHRFDFAFLTAGPHSAADAGLWPAPEASPTRARAG